MKLTKKSYNRRMFALGALLFLSIGLVSTGFAAFVMSKGANANADGYIQVGTIEDGSVTIENVGFIDGNDKILFEAFKGDEEGEVKWDKKTPDVYENLSVTLTAEVSPVSYVQDFTINLDSTNAGIKAAADAGYITLPDCWGVNKDIKSELTRKSTDATSPDYEVYVLSYELKFGWGTEFGGKNPSIFLDEKDDAGNYKLSYDQKKQKLLDFKKTIYAMDPAATEEQVFAKSDALQFSATLTVTANV